jgi:hypothetical protein
LINAHLYYECVCVFVCMFCVVVYECVCRSRRFRVVQGGVIGLGLINVYVFAEIGGLGLFKGEC